MSRNFFEEALAFDVRHAFLNPDEFGVPMNVDGLDTVGIWDDAVAPAEGHYESNVETWGVHQLRRALHVPSTGEGAVPLPRPRQDMRIDGTLWTVDDAVDQHGLIRINLYRNGS